MSSNQANVAPISVTQPSTAGKGRVDLVKSDFDALIAQKGLDVYLDKVIFCPCRSIGDNQALSSCRNCGGSGYVYINRYQTKMVIQSMNLETKFKEWSEERIGSARITARDEDRMSFMDRITLIDVTTINSQVLHPQIIDGKVRCKTIYPIVDVEYIFTFINGNTLLGRLHENSDYTINGNEIILNDKYSTYENLTISIRYDHEPSYHVIDMTRDVMNTTIMTGDGERKVVMPISAIARKSHYVIDEQNYNGTYLLDNSFGQENTCGGGTEKKIVKTPTMFRASMPTNTSIVLYWQDNENNETNYILERAGLNGVWQQIAVLPANSVTYSDNSVQAGTAYFYRLAAKNNGVQSEWSESIGLITNT